MKTTITIHEPADTLSDARHRQGAAFRPSICALLDDGYAVKIETTGNAQTFTTAAEFVAWFDQASVTAAEYPDPVDDDLDARYADIMADPKA